MNINRKSSKSPILSRSRSNKTTHLLLPPPPPPPPLKTKLTRPYIKNKTQLKQLVQTFKNQEKREKQQKTKKRTLKKLVKSVHTRNLLQDICSNSGQCVGFGGANRKLINRFFNNFTSFEFVKYPISRIGEPSSNGFIYEITYNKLKYEACAILKSAVKHESDNLAYEYLAGLFINNINDYFPCFLETYGLFSYKNEKTKERMYNNKTITDKDILKDNLLLENTFGNENNMDYARMCETSQNLCLLIQHIQSAETLNSFVEHWGYLNVMNYELVYILFQIYYCLSSLRNVYTHYDLHSNNVLLYEPLYEDKYIEFHYHMEDGTTTVFISQYIPKIIDYGRSFFNDNTNENLKSVNIHNKLCNTPECNNNQSVCGDDDGFSHLYDNTDNFYFIDAKKHNVSHDLRLMGCNFDYYIEKIGARGTGLTDSEATKCLKTIFPRIEYGVGLTSSDDKHRGTQENTADPSPDDKIYNVKNMFDELHKVVLLPNVKRQNLVQSGQKGGELHVYPYYTSPTEIHKNKPTRFIPF